MQQNEAHVSIKSLTTVPIIVACAKLLLCNGFVKLTLLIASMSGLTRKEEFVVFWAGENC